MREVSGSQFMAERCSYDQGKKVLVSELYSAFEAYCQRHDYLHNDGFFVCSKRQFTDDLKEAGMKTVVIDGCHYVLDFRFKV